MSKSRFKCEAKVGKGGKIVPATVTIWRGIEPMIEVRPSRSRETYSLALSDVAEMIVWRASKQKVYGT